MNDSNSWKVSKWPFFVVDALLWVFAFVVVSKLPHPIGRWEMFGCFGAAGLGAVIGILPFLLEYRAVGKLVDLSALGTVADKIQNLELLAARIDAATSQWVNVQTQAEKISTGAKEITDRMAEEIRGFSDFMQKINDREKATMRLETEKLRRGEGEWLQVLVAILDHVFALHAAAEQSGQRQVADQIGVFKNACLGAVRRVGLVPFVAGPDEPFNPERHQAVDAKNPPAADAAVAETVGVGYTFQGRLLRMAFVRLRETTAAPASGVPKTEPAELPLAEGEAAPLPLGEDEANKV